MATSHAAIVGSTESLRPVKRALISVSDKTELVEFVKGLSRNGVEILSTGGTAAKLREAGITVIDVSEVTGFPEILNGRVKTLHPKIHGGLLAVRGNQTHEEQLKEHDIGGIDMLVVNLYPFEETVASGKLFDQCIENIDIGGPAMLRAAAKNFQSVAVVTSTAQYDAVADEFSKNSGDGGLFTSREFRQRLAAEAFELTAKYDRSIANYFTKEDSIATVAKTYEPVISLKYGCNPNQKPASLCEVNGNKLPFEVLNGTPGYINFLDALNAWQLVHEVRKRLDLPAATSFKHVSPAGAAVFAPLTDSEVISYELNKDKVAEMSQLEVAFIRARQADPMSSFGDFIALSDVVDIKTAKRIKTEISDGLIAPGFEPEALEILKAKKGGKFIVIQVDASFEPNDMEYREVFGVGFAQTRNKCEISKSILEDIVTKNKEMTEEAKRDLILGSIALKYTQSNSVGFAKNGQMIGVGAGQQSRVDCVKLSGKKARIWCLRQHPKVRELKFKKGVKRQDRINARVRFIENDFGSAEKEEFLKMFEGEVKFLTSDETNDFLKTFEGISLVSDAFFPFRDNIDVCHNLKFKVGFVAQAGGSIKDPSVIEACDEYNMVMALTKQRLFHH